MDNYGYIYVTENLINNKVYIGQRKGEFNPDYLGSGKHLKSSIRKYGKSNFKTEVLSYAKDKPELDKLEIQYIKEYKDRFTLYNITEGGGGFVGKRGPQSHEHKHKLRLAKLGKRLSLEHRKKIGLASIGRKKTPEGRERIRLSKLGDNNPQKRPEVREKNRIAHLGKVRSDEVKEKIRLGTIERYKNMKERRKTGMASLQAWKRKKNAP